MFNLVHISDPHLGPLPDVRPSQLVSKRLLGYINWQRNRVNSMTNAYLEALIDDIHRLKPDHIALTGDLVNIALPDEVTGARKWLEQLGQPEDISVIPGNHDAYTPGALKKAWEQWHGYMRGDDQYDLPAIHGKDLTFPYVRKRGPVALVGLSTARATGPFMATGHMSDNQLRLLTDSLRHLREQGYFRVVMLHHPPIREATNWHKRFVGASRFGNVIAEAGAELILHGHTHQATRMEISLPDGQNVPVICVPSASNAPGGHRPASRYNHFQISGSKQDGWSCLMKERGFTSAHSGVVDIDEHQLTIPA